jgi:type I pantothenate kinase
MLSWVKKMHELTNYQKISRSDWQDLFQNNVPLLSSEELEEIKSLNDSISLQDVQEIYIPLIHLIGVYMRAYDNLSLGKEMFLRKFMPAPPFIIGISGSVAVGKSTTARLLQILLSRTFKRKQVDLITTDGFLYPNQELIRRNILDRKGFPESYDMEKLLTFLIDVKSGKSNVKSPVYSHNVYDIVKDAYDVTDNPDILIVEGINVLQLPENQRIYVSDFFDFSLYVDAKEENIENWYLERFEALLDSAFQKPDNYYYQFANWPRERAVNEAKKIWRAVNQKNLEQFILPTRTRADVILHKDDKHSIEDIYLKKY